MKKLERLAIPKKGRVFQHIFETLTDAGFNLSKKERLDFCVCQNLGIEVYFLPAKDIPNAVASGAIHYGITGIDLIEDSKASVDNHLMLGIGKAKMVLATPEKHPYKGPKSLNGKKIGTSYMELTKKFLRRNQVKNTTLVYFSGSVEIQVKLGVVDAIVDVSSTGTSLLANQLAVRETLLQSEMVLIGNKKHKGPALEIMKKRILRVLRGRSHVLLKFNIPKSALKKACSLSQGMSSPTVNELADPKWLALEVAVSRSELHTLMDKLSDLGATGILSCDLHLCVPSLA